MIRYDFSGHLSPRPAGTENAMCALSGQVYLATDVERRNEMQVNEITRLTLLVNSLQAANRDLKSRLRTLRRTSKGKTDGEVAK